MENGLEAANQLFLTHPRLFGGQSFQDLIMEWVRVGQGSKLLHSFVVLATGRLAMPFPEMGRGQDVSCGSGSLGVSVRVSEDH